MARSRALVFITSKSIAAAVVVVGCMTGGAVMATPPKEHPTLAPIGVPNPSPIGKPPYEPKRPNFWGEFQDFNPELPTFCPFDGNGCMNQDASWALEDGKWVVRLNNAQDLTKYKRIRLDIVFKDIVIGTPDPKTMSWGQSPQIDSQFLPQGTIWSVLHWYVGWNPSQHKLSMTWVLDKQPASEKIILNQLVMRLNGGGLGSFNPDWVKALAVISHCSPIPEPDSWLLMIAGFILMGGMVRVRRRTNGALADDLPLSFSFTRS